MIDPLSSVAGVEERFHPPFPNNFVRLLVPRERELAAYVAQIKASTEALNHADEGLLGCCAAQLVAAPDPVAERALEAWRDCIRRRVNLQSIRWASAVMARLPLQPRLEHEHPDVLARFRDVPRTLLEVVRLNGYLAPDRIAPTLRALTEDLRDPVLAAAVDRIEVARLLPDVDPAANDYPTLIVYLETRATTDDALAWTIEHIASRFEASPAAPNLRPQYACRLTPNATLTQGFYLYKRYLDLVGLLDELYDPASGHALTRPTLGGITRALPCSS